MMLALEERFEQADILLGGGIEAAIGTLVVQTRAFAPSGHDARSALGVGELETEASEVFDEQAVAGEQMLHALRETQGLDMALEDDSVEAFESASDFVTESIYNNFKLLGA